MGYTRSCHSRSKHCCDKSLKFSLNFSELMETSDSVPRGTGESSTSEDSFSLMRTYLERQFHSLKRELREEVKTSSESSYKRFKVRNAHDFKYKGNKKQHDFNIEIREDLDIAGDFIRNGYQTRSLDQLKAVKRKIDKRNKLIKLADRSAGG